MSELKWWSLHKHERNGEYFVTPAGINVVQHYFIKNFQVPPPYFLCACAYKGIYKALEQLGYKDPEFSVERIAENRYSVILDNKYFGVYDTTRKTFVD